MQGIALLSVVGLRFRISGAADLAECHFFLGGKFAGKALFPIFRKGLEIVYMGMLGGLT